MPVSIVLRYKNPIIHGSLVIKKDVIEAIGNYNDDFKYSQDYELVTRLIKKTLELKSTKKYYMN